MRTFSIRPIQENIHNQLEATQGLLDVVDTLSEIKKTLSTEQQEPIAELEQKIANITNKLMDNAEQTSVFVRKVAF